MPSKAQKIQTNFNGGILSPYIEGRPDVAQFFNGMLTGRNICLLPEGGFENTPGTKYITSTKDDGEAILIAFQPTDETGFELEFGVEYIRFRKNGELVLTGDGELLTNGGFDTDITGWTDFSAGTAAASWGPGGYLVLTPEVALVGSHLAAVNFAAVFQSLVTTPGETYTVTYRVYTGAPRVIATNAADAVWLQSAHHPPGIYSFDFTAVSALSNIVISSEASTAAVYVDYISCELLTQTPYEIASPFNADDLAEIKGGQGIRQSVDVLFIVCSRLAPIELVYAGDLDWTLRYSPFDPMPSVEADTDISGGTITLTPAATTGDSINFTASSACFLEGDVGRVIKYGAARALIVTYTNTSVVAADILSAFPDTDPIPAGEWLLEGSPANATLDVTHKGPVGRSMTATASVATFRSTDLGKFIKTYGGLLEITKVSSTTRVTVKIKAELTDADAWNPSAAPAGSWTLEIAAWSDTLGWPTLNEFFQGRYVLASNANQKTTIWMSQTNDFYNFAIGSLATDAVQYTHRSGTYGQMKWLLENGGALYFGDGFSEHSLKGPGVDQPVGGDTVPTNKPESHNGSARMRPIHVGSSLLFLNWSKKKVLASAYNFDRDAQIAKQSTFLTRDLTIDVDETITQGLSEHAPCYAQEPIPLIYWLRNDGVLLVQSFNDDPEGGNNGWTTLELDGEVESYCVTRRSGQHVLSLIVNRTINGSTVRYIEEISRDAHTRVESAWTEMQTQAAIILEKADSADQTVFSGLDHLEGETVDVLLYRTGQVSWQVPRWMGQFVVSSGDITLDETINYACKLEVGLAFTPLVKTMRATIADAPVDGHLRKWTKCLLRLQKSSLPEVNGTDMMIGRSMDNFDQGPYLRSGDYFCDTSDLPDAEIKKWDYSLDGYVEITRNKPYPLRVLMLAGEIVFSESMAEMTNNEGTIHEP